MITRPKNWLVCNKCGEFFTEEMLKEGETCKDCGEGKVYWECVECGKSLGECGCGTVTKP